MPSTIRAIPVRQWSYQFKVDDCLYPPDLRHLASVYLTLLISGGQIGLPMVILAASMCRKVNWHPTIINFCLTWIVYSIVYCLKLYTGDDEESRHWKMCIAQASMINGAAPMAVIAGLAIVLHTWTTLQCIALGRIAQMLYLALLLGTPYLVFVTFSVGAGLFVVAQPQSVCSNGLYCIIQLGRPAVVVPSFCAAVMVIILALEGVITLQCYRQWKIIKTSFPLAARTPSLSCCFRLGLVCLYSCVTLTSAILFLSDMQTMVTYMLPAALPLGALIVFGMREGVISSCTTIFRGRKQSGSSLGLEVPSARAASSSDPTLTTDELLEEISIAPSTTA